MAKSRRKVRRCQCCNEILPPTYIYLCEKCVEAGMQGKMRRIEAQELLQIARHREKSGMDPIEGLSMVQVNMLARLFRPPYATYGRFRAYIQTTGKLPPEEYLREE